MTKELVEHALFLCDLGIEDLTALADRATEAERKEELECLLEYIFPDSRESSRTLAVIAIQKLYGEER